MTRRDLPDLARLVAVVAGAATLAVVAPWWVTATVATGAVGGVWWWARGIPAVTP